MPPTARADKSARDTFKALTEKPPQGYVFEKLMSLETPIAADVYLCPVEPDE